MARQMRASRARPVRQMQRQHRPWRSSSSSSIIRRPSRVPGCQSSGTSVAAAISLQQRRDRQHAALRGQVRGRARLDNTVRMRGSPLMRMPCATQAGTHTPRVGGTTQMPPRFLHHHHARDRVEQLRAAMTMAAHAMAVLVVHRQSGHGPRRGFVGEQVQVRGCGMVARRRGAGRGRRNVLFDDSCLIGGRRSVSVYLPSFPFT